jgi:hypothetical protein
MGRYLHQIKRPLTRHLQGIEGRHNPQLFAVLVNHAYLAGANAFVGADKRFGGAFIDRGNNLPPQRASQAAMPLLDLIAGLQWRSHIA